MRLLLIEDKLKRQTGALSGKGNLGHLAQPLCAQGIKGQALDDGTEPRGRTLK